MPKNPSEIRSSRSCSSAQLAVHQHIMQRTARHLGKLADAWEGGFNWIGSFSKYESASSSCYEKVFGDDVDLPSTAATCDPALLACEELWRLVVQPDNVFPSTSEPSGLVREAPLTGQEREEYLRLTVRELQRGKLRLRHTVKGRARVVAAPKSAEGRQRKIWDGSALSSIAAVPPAPHRLANPSSFLDLLVRPGEKLLLSKRDASTFFDSLKVPKALQEWFGQAPVRVGELLSLGLKLDDIRSWTDDLGEKQLLKQTELFPVNVVWPMGFSWSSCIAQDTSVGCVLEAGVAEKCILSLDHALPEHQEELCAVATDDIMFFHKNRHRGRATLCRLDRVFVEHGVSKNCKKDVSLSSSMTGLGCEISSSPPLVEPAGRNWEALCCVFATCFRVLWPAPRLSVPCWASCSGSASCKEACSVSSTRSTSSQVYRNSRSESLCLNRYLASLLSSWLWLRYSRLLSTGSFSTRCWLAMPPPSLALESVLSTVAAESLKRLGGLLSAEEIMSDCFLGLLVLRCLGGARSTGSSSKNSSFAHSSPAKRASLLTLVSWNVMGFF